MIAYAAVCFGFWTAVVLCTLAACRVLDFIVDCAHRRRAYLARQR